MKHWSQFKEAKRIGRKYLAQIAKYAHQYAELSSSELQQAAQALHALVATNKALNEAEIAQACAICQEASTRTLGLTHYPVQLIGGLAMYQEAIVEMRTGEGKTLVATIPAYLHALQGRCVHIVTVNDYLAKRDAAQMGELFSFLGFKTTCVTSEMSIIEKQAAYQADIVYVTNSEVGFDYLRAHMTYSQSEQVLPTQHVAIVDEADSILIDEARTPLIITETAESTLELPHQANAFVQSLTSADYEIDYQTQTIFLRESGITKAEEHFQLANYAHIQHASLQHAIHNALRAVHLMTKDVDYIIHDSQIVLVDEHTGRLGKNRRFGNGLHQAIEAKEFVPIQPETEIKATITYQHFFRQYDYLMGMTGTAITEQEEFAKTYGLAVIEVPTQKPVQRRDNPDKLYVTQAAKCAGIVKDVKRNWEKGRPVLVGTIRISDSEMLSSELTKAGVPHQLLNAKQHEKEAEIVANAGQFGAVTVATSMAGRGTDIVLTPETRQLGGLKVIGFERAINRRIDNQLCGRSGRQGDPGVTQFYLSLEDELILHVPKQYKDIISNANRAEAQAIKNKHFNSMIPKCQRIIEGQHATARQETLAYDAPLQEQRAIVYTQRQLLLEAPSIIPYCHQLIDALIEEQLKNPTYSECVPGLLNESELTMETWDNWTGLHETLVRAACHKALERQVTIHGEAPLRRICLEAIDSGWHENLQILNDLRYEVRYLPNPKQAFLERSHEAFDTMVQSQRWRMIADCLRFRMNDEN